MVAVKDEIQACVQALHHVREEVETRQGELAVRNVKMVDQEVDARLLDLRLTILEEQKSKLTAANNTMTSELVNIHRVTHSIVSIMLCAILYLISGDVKNAAGI